VPLRLQPGREVLFQSDAGMIRSHCHPHGRVWLLPARRPTRAPARIAYRLAGLRRRSRDALDSVA
jgi:hypothetical protein